MNKHFLRCSWTLAAFITLRVIFREPFAPTVELQALRLLAVQGNMKLWGRHPPAIYAGYHKPLTATRVDTIFVYMKTDIV